MLGIRYVEKSSQAPNGRIVGEIFEEAQWIYKEDELPFTFEIISCGYLVWSTELYPGTWACWDCLDNEDLVAIIKNKENKIISQFKLDIWTNRNSTEQFFDTWMTKNPNTNGLVIGTHDGTTGEWVKHVRNKSTNVLLVEGSKKQFKELVFNYYNFENVRFINNIVTSDGRDVQFFEYGTGHANTIDEEHYKKHDTGDGVNILNVKSIGINDLIIQEGLQDKLDWMHLDTEAIDDEIIMALDFSRIKKPKLIVFETINFSEEKTGSPDRINKLFDWLHFHGYRTKYDYWNSFAYFFLKKNFD